MKSKRVVSLLAFAMLFSFVGSFAVNESFNVSAEGGTGESKQKKEVPHGKSKKVDAKPDGQPKNNPEDKSKKPDGKSKEEVENAKKEVKNSKINTEKDGDKDGDKDGKGGGKSVPATADNSNSSFLIFAMASLLASVVGFGYLLNSNLKKRRSI
ncbi:MAG: hypothetical protein LBI55_03285 [Oscillospiraceae bacterium]|jgi:hypothetical protein|nr:hypothetical protein [Oscillospiraceae bacterium]